MDNTNTQVSGGASDNFDPNSEGHNYENEARAQGWRPQEEWSGDPERWVDAETFVTRAQSWSGHLKKEIEELRSLMRQQAILNKKHQEDLINRYKTREQELEAHIANLETQRADAISRSNGADAVALERGIREAEKELSQTQKAVKETTLPPINPEDAALAASWKTKNTWYGKDTLVTNEADVLGNTYAQLNPDKPLSQVLDYVEKEIKLRYPQYSGRVTGPNSSQGNNDSSSGVRNVQSQEDSKSNVPKWNDLDEVTKGVADQLIKRKVFKNRQAYLEASAMGPEINIADQYSKKQQVQQGK